MEPTESDAFEADAGHAMGLMLGASGDSNIP